MTAEVRSFTKDRRRVASLKVTNSGTEHIRKCTGRLISVTSIKGLEQTVNPSSAMYLRWSQGDGGGKHLTFAGEAHLDVVVMEKPYTGKMLVMRVRL